MPQISVSWVRLNIIHPQFQWTNVDKDLSYLSIHCDHLKCRWVMVKIWGQIGDYMGDHVGNLEHIIQATYDSKQLGEYIGTYGEFSMYFNPHE